MGPVPVLSKKALSPGLVVFRLLLSALLHSTASAQYGCGGGGILSGLFGFGGGGGYGGYGGYGAYGGGAGMGM